MLERQRRAAERTATRAGALIRRQFTSLRRSQIHTKAANELVTDVDRQSNRLIVRELLRQFPDYGILAEEGLNRPTRSGFVWVIDPLDGTTNYVTHLPYFCVSIALMVNGNPILGVIEAPLTDERFTAVVGQGARRNGRRIRVTSTRAISQSIVSINYCHSRLAIDRAFEMTRRLRYAAHHLRHAGSAALDLAYVAAGRLDATIMAGVLRPWDITAGVVIVREAGGEISDLAGQPFTFRSTDLLASNRLLHQPLLRKLR